MVKTCQFNVHAKAFQQSGGEAISPSPRWSLLMVEIVEGHR